MRPGSCDELVRSPGFIACPEPRRHGSASGGQHDLERREIPDGCLGKCLECLTMPAARSEELPFGESVQRAVRTERVGERREPL